MRFVLSLFMLVCLHFAFSQEPLMQHKMYGNNQLSLVYGDSVIYTAINQIDGYANEPVYQRGAVLVRWNGKQIAKNKYITLNNEKLSVSFFSDNDSIIEFIKPSGFNSQGGFKVKYAGTVTIGCVFNEDTLKSKVVVKALDLETNFSETIIEKMLGNASSKTSQSVSYGKTKVIDGIEYDCTQLVRGLNVKHLLYSEYPGLVIVLNPHNDKRNALVKQPAWEMLRKELLNLF